MKKFTKKNTHISSYINNNDTNAPLAFVINDVNLTDSLFYIIDDIDTPIGFAYIDDVDVPINFI